MEKLKLRDEIAVSNTWDLTKIYPSDEAWYNELETLKQEYPAYDQYKETMMENAEQLYALLKFDEKISRKLEKLYVYASMKSDQDKGNTTYLEMNSNIESLYQEIIKKSVYITPTLLKYPYSKIESWYQEKPELKEFELSLQEVYRYQPHTLSEEKEKLLATYAGALNTIDNVFDVLTNSDMNLGTMKSEDGEEVELTEGNYSIFIRSKNREVRKIAFEKLFAGYEQFKNTIASTFVGNIEKAKAYAETHNYSSSLQSFLFRDELTEDIYQTLIDTVTDKMDVIKKYFQLKKEVLGLDEMHLYDIYVDIVKGSDKTYSFKEAQTMVEDALSIFGEEYQKTLHRAFTERWIDIYPNKGKRSGAYSGGCYDTIPYVLLNYNGSLNDVSTLAHELGHSMHSYYARTNNPYQTGDYCIFVAEIASTVNELLLSHYLLEHTNDKNEKLQILAELMELFKGTIYRQTMFAEFEKMMHDKKQQGIALTSDTISRDYYELNKKYFADEVVLDEQIQYEWARIPHFYTPFYVFKYATGLSCACKIVTDILENKPNAKENYIAFLKHGSKDHPMKHLQMVGIDITKPDYIESAIDMFNQTIEDFKRIYHS